MNPALEITPALIAQLIAVARRAGDAIMTIYQQRDNDSNKPFNIQQKADMSPLTAADLAAHREIVECLPQLLPLPIISEEGVLPEYAERARWESYWLVDPLDGTKEFIAGNGEFTVNIALIHRGHPCLGVVHVPVTDITYVGAPAAQDRNCVGAWKFVAGTNPQALRVRSLVDSFKRQIPFTALLSHRHATQATMDVMATIAVHWPGKINTTSAGSSLKFCVIAEGAADFYPRLAPTSEWDTAAAQAVLEAAGGRVVKVPTAGELTFTPLMYNTNADMLNPHFYALGDPNYDWQQLLTASAARIELI